MLLLLKFCSQELSKIAQSGHTALKKDLAKFRHFGTSLKVLGNFLGFWQKCFTIGQIFIVVDGQIV